MLRDKFAMAALSGICASEVGKGLTYEIRAKFAYEQADAMMKEREKYADQLVEEYYSDLDLPDDVWEAADQRHSDRHESKRIPHGVKVVEIPTPYSSGTADAVWAEAFKHHEALHAKVFPPDGETPPIKPE